MRRLLTYLLFLVPLLIAIEPPVMLAVTTKPSTDVETSPSTDPDTSAYTFHCPTNGECKFFDSEPPNTACTTEGWTATSGVDADMCDNRRFNADGSDGTETLTRTDFTGHTDSTTVDIIFDVEYRGNQGGTTAETTVALGTSASPSECIMVLATNGLPESSLLNATLWGSPLFENVGDRVQIMMRYDAASGVCHGWVDNIGVRPGIGELNFQADQTEASTSGSGQVFDTVELENADGNINIIIRHFAWCAPGPCLF